MTRSMLLVCIGVENVFWRGIKAWARILLPNLRLKADADLKVALSIKSVVAAIGEITEAEPNDDDQVPSVAAPLLHMDMLTTIPLPSVMCVFMRNGTHQPMQGDFLSL